MSKKSIILTTSVFLGILTFLLSAYTVGETEQSVVVQFGEVVKVVIDEEHSGVVGEIKNSNRFSNVEISTHRGLNFKIPIIQHVEKFDQRLHTYDTEPREVTTKDKKKLILDNNAQWKVVNPLLFKVTMGNERSAHVRIDDLLYSKINEKIGKTEAHTIIADKDYVQAMLAEVAVDINDELCLYGIEMVDIKIKRTDLPPDNSKNVYNRMRTEREQQATKYRSEGEEQALNIKSLADKEVTILLAQANAEAEKTKGEGDAIATEIYNKAYSKDPSFYEFYKTLQTYKNTIDDKTTIVIDKDSPFAKYLFGKY